MMNILSIRNLGLLFGAALLCAPSARADEKLFLPRMPGDRLDVSMGNEVTHAALSAQDWLMRQQNADGSWGKGTNQLYQTMLVLFTLKSFHQPEAAAACEKGDAFLASLIVPFPSYPFGCNIHLPLEELAKTWPPAAGTSGRRWLEISSSINRQGGKLMSGDEPIDWRREVGQRLIDTQKVSPQGGGFWRAVPGVTSSDIEETAFTMLVFFEL